MFCVADLRQEVQSIVISGWATLRLQYLVFYNTYCSEKSSREPGGNTPAHVLIIFHYAITQMLICCVDYTFQRHRPFI